MLRIPVTLPRTALLVSILAAPALCQSAQLQVSNHGLDSNNCSSSAPCRSISEAIHKARAGDTISVLPGLYGDLNQNGVLGEPGEESGEIGYGCDCVVKVDKAVTIISQGALVTRIDVRRFAELGQPVYGVRITADNAVFGQPGKGFQISGSNYFAMRIDGAHVSAGGNVASGTESGFYVFGSYDKLDNNLWINGSGAGFDIVGSHNSVVNSLASGGGAGFQVETWNPRPVGNTFSNDIATGNQVGFNIFGPADISGSAALGNYEAGITIRAGGQASVRNSNIFGNGSFPATNCGIENFSGTALSVSKAYWGWRTGPGADPADAICDYNGSKTTATAPQASPYDISFKP